MKIFKNVLLTLLIFNFYSCNKNIEYFNGELFFTDLPLQIDTLEGKEIILNDIYTGTMVVCEDILCFISYKHPDAYLYAYDIESGNRIGKFCMKGNGPDEFASIFFFNQLDIENDKFNLWLGKNELELVKLDLTNSIKANKSIYNPEKLLLNWENRYGKPFSMVFSIDEKTILAKIPPLYLYNDEIDYSPTEYNLIDVVTGQIEEKYILYNHPLINPFKKDDKNFPVDFYFLSYDKLKPDKSKVAMCMYFMGQINILDLYTGELKGFRMKDTPDFEYLKSDPENFNIFYLKLEADDDYIYVPYVNESFSAMNGVFNKPLHEIHVYDWDGNFVKILYLEKEFNSINLDSKNKLLYTKNDTTEEIYYYDLN